MNTVVEWFKQFYANTSIGIQVLDILFLLMLVVLLGVIVWFNKRTLRYIGILVLSIIIYIIVRLVGLPISLYLLENSIEYWLIVIALLFFNEFRLMFESMDLRRTRRTEQALSGQFIKTLMKSVEELSKHKVGALITIENTQSLDEYISRAIQMDAMISQEILEAIFNVQAPTHDGAIIIREGRIACCGAYFPMTMSDQVSKSMGSRHRAAIGISEAFDCLTIVVSEESGRISVTYDGIIDRNIGKDGLQNFLNQYIEN